MESYDIRKTAREKLRGNWGIFAIIAFLKVLITLSYAIFLPYGVVMIIGLIIDGAFLMSFSLISIRVVIREKIKTKMLFDGFRHFGKAFLLNLLINLLVILWSLLFIIPGIVKSYSYSMSYYILADNNDISVNEAIKRSKEIMRGYKADLFSLHLSFFGWIFLSVFTFGILYFWIKPYIETARAEFYHNLIPSSLPQQLS